MNDRLALRYEVLAFIFAFLGLKYEIKKAASAFSLSFLLVAVTP